MRAMAITEHGSPEVLKYIELPEPEIGDFDLLVQVQATSVNPVDCRVRRSSKVPRKFPLILGYDVCGRVIAMGSKAAGFQIGDEIYASPNVFRDGANAEYVAVDSRSACKKPKTLDAAEAAVLPLVTLTAWESLHHRLRIRAGETVLIHAGAGGVGHVALQLAKLHGCRAITTAGRPESIAFCREILKADEVIDYTAQDFAKQVMNFTDGKGCAAIFDTVGGEVFEKSLDCIAINGKIVTIVPTETPIISDKLFLKNATLHYEFMGVPTAYNLNPEIQGEILGAVANLVDSGLLRSRVTYRFPLSELAEAHRLQESGHVLGKIAVIVAN